MTELDFKVVPEQADANPPSFDEKVHVWDVGCVSIFVAYLLGGAIASAMENAMGIVAFLLFILAAILLTVSRWSTRKERSQEQSRMKSEEWMREQLRKREKDALDVTSSAIGLIQAFQANFTRLPRLLRSADESIAAAEREFREQAYAPFWDKVEEGAVGLGSFNRTVKTMSDQVASFNRILQRRTHNFPPLRAQVGELPNASGVVERLRQVVRMGQTDFKFATIWEHRKTQNVLIEGFNTLGDAIGNLGWKIEHTSEQFVSALRESSESTQGALGEVRSEQVRLREGFEAALQKWEVQKTRYGV